MRKSTPYDLCQKSKINLEMNSQKNPLIIHPEILRKCFIFSFSQMSMLFVFFTFPTTLWIPYYSRFLTHDLLRTWRGKLFIQIFDFPLLTSTWTKAKKMKWLREPLRINFRPTTARVDSRRSAAISRCEEKKKVFLFHSEKNMKMRKSNKWKNEITIQLFYSQIWNFISFLRFVSLKGWTSVFRVPKKKPPRDGWIANCSTHSPFNLITFELEWLIQINIDFHVN